MHIQTNNTYEAKRHHTFGIITGNIIYEITDYSITKNNGILLSFEYYVNHKIVTRPRKEAILDEAGNELEPAKEELSTVIKIPLKTVKDDHFSSDEINKMFDLMGITIDKSNGFTPGILANIYKISLVRIMSYDSPLFDVPINDWIIKY